MSGGQSFATRLIIPVTFAGALVIGGGLYLDYRQARAQIIEDLTLSAAAAIQGATARLDEMVRGTESSVRALASALRAVPDAGETDRILRGVIESNPHIFASALALDPAVTAERHGRAPYRYRLTSGTDMQLGAADLASAPVPYWQEAWFTRPRRAGQPVWVPPYYEATGVHALMTTFSAPIFGAGASSPDRRFLGVLTADVVLTSLTPYLEELTLDRAGFGFILSSEGLVIGAPEGSVIGESIESMFPGVPALAGGAWREAAADTDYSAPVPCPREEEAECLLRLHQVGGSPWSVGVVYSAEQLLAPLKRYARRSAVLGGGMLALLAFLISAITRRLTRPLVGLAQASGAIARGDLDGPLPEVAGNDEVARLVRAFDAMRGDLRHHIREVENAAAERSRLQGEMAAAAEIQRAMLPQGGEAHLRASRAELWARLRPARAVGGDLYSYELYGEQLLFAIGDVSDKGIAAALFMARAIALIGQWESQHAAVPPDIALQQINDSLSQDNERCMFLTLTLGCLDLKTGVLTFASAGHTPPLLLRDGAVQTLAQDRGPALALQAGLVFPVNAITLGADDRLVFYTDGFDEAADTTGSSLGEEALGTAARVADDLPLDEAGEHLFDAVDTFAAGAPQHDDMTLLQLEIPGQRRAPLQADHRSFALDDTLVAATRRWLEEHWRAQGLDEDNLGDFRLLLEEIACNVRDHSGLPATSELTLSLARFVDRVELTCVDAGRPFDPLEDAAGAPLGLASDEAPIGGLGVHLIRRLSDEQSYRREDGRNILRVRKRLPAARADGH